MNQNVLSYFIWHGLQLDAPLIHFALIYLGL